jgi:hypothetical protein
MSEDYVDIVEKREVDSGEKVLQVLVSTQEPKGGESRKDRACERMLARLMPAN